MKKLIVLCALIASFQAWQSCSPKSKEETHDAVSADVTAESKEVKKKEELAARRARIDKAEAEREDARRKAADDMAKKSPTYKDANGKLVYYKPEKPATYKGGNSAMIGYLKDNLKYPKDAVDEGTEATVFVEFVVASNGAIRDVNASEIVKEGADNDQSMKDEAVRVVKAMPEWASGQQNGKNVNTKVSIPIRFTLGN